jgi:predicted transcriptional regulator
MTAPIPTARELDVLSILWRNGSGTVNEVRDQLADDLSYTTVLWVLQTLEQKGYVKHTKEGRAYRYHPVLEPEETGRSALGRILDKVFHGSAEFLLAQLVQERSLAPDELERMRTLLDERLTRRKE